jgi:predicted nuclease of predicted toxin-antitoxin system
VKIVADEGVDRQVVDELRSLGHDVLYIAESEPGIDDETVLARSRESGAVLITADKDFGELVFRQGRLHSGVVLLRLFGLTPQEKAQIVGAALERHADELPDRFAVISERSLRLRGGTRR